MRDLAIRARGVGKSYQVYASQRDRLLHALWTSYRAGVEEVRALEGVNFEVPRGEAVAVIGRNGSGKSTLLQILTGTLVPSEGSVEVSGRVCALLELGSGFNPEYTGRENAVMNGLLLGLGRGEILDRMDDIVAFADIGEAIDRPVKTYSSGMTMRLAFAVQAFTDPDILLIDEALAVGDFFFQQKCFRHLRSLRDKGVTVVLVSHDMAAVRDLCPRSLLLKDGRVAFAGDSLDAIRLYLGEVAAGIRDEAKETRSSPLAADGSIWIRPPLDAYGESAAKGQLLSVSLFDARGAPLLQARIGDEIAVRVAYRSLCDEPLDVNVVLRNRYDQVVTVVSSHTARLAAPVLRPGEEAAFEVRMRMMLEAGRYSLVAGLAQAAPGGGTGTVIEETPSLGPVEVSWDYAREVPPFYGMFGLETTARFVPPVGASIPLEEAAR